MLKEFSEKMKKMIKDEHEKYFLQKLRTTG